MVAAEVGTLNECSGDSEGNEDNEDNEDNQDNIHQDNEGNDYHGDYRSRPGRIRNQ